jgi:hypothetical protein
VIVDTQEWADRTVSVHEVGGRWEVRLWMGVTLKGTDHWAPWTWMPLASFGSEAEAGSYRRAAAQILENALRLSLRAVREGRLVARPFPELRLLAERRKGGLT